MTDRPATGLPPDLARWIEAATGGTVTGAERIEGGNRRQAWIVDAQRIDGAGYELFLRFDPADPAATGDVYTLWREACVYRALSPTAVAIPRLIAVHPTTQAMLTARIPGESAFHAVADEQVRTAVAADFMEALAALHRVDPAALDLGPLGPVRTLSEHIREELAIWEGLYRHTGRFDPMVELGLTWLTRNVPPDGPPVVVVHGDAGPGNFVFSDGRVQALVDWEFAHLGDAMEDLAWLSMRSVFETFPDFGARLSDYEQATGRPVDRDRIKFHRVLVQWRVAIIRHRDAGNLDSSSDATKSLMSWAVNRRLFTEALADAAELPIDTVEVPPCPPSELTWVYEAVLDQLRRVIVPRSTDPLATAKAKGLARLVKFLEACDRNAADFAAAELEDLTSVLGSRPPTLAEGRTSAAARIRAGAVADEVALGYLVRQAARDTALMRPALGVLADRHLPDLGEPDARSGAAAGSGTLAAVGASGGSA